MNNGLLSNETKWLAEEEQRVIFDNKIPTPKGASYAGYFKTVTVLIPGNPNLKLGIQGGLHCRSPFFSLAASLGIGFRFLKAG